MGGADEAPVPRVLVVDDSEAVRGLIAVNLELEGYDVRTAADGEGALEVKPPGAARGDPGRDDARARRLRDARAAARGRDGGHPDGDGHRPRAGRRPGARRAPGVEAYLTKPFEPAELVSVVASLARGGRPTPPR